MSDELPEKADKAIRTWLAAIGFTLVIVGGEMMAEKDGARFGLGTALVIGALPVHLAWVFWQKVKPWLGATTLRELSAIAVSPRWWFGSILILLAALIFEPVIAVPRWPTLPFSRTELATIPTTLRLQFNAVDAKPKKLKLVIFTGLLRVMTNSGRKPRIKNTSATLILCIALDTL